jgi:hypothetical protein
MRCPSPGLKMTVVPTILKLWETIRIRFSYSSCTTAVSYVSLYDFIVTFDKPFEGEEREIERIDEE